jgi:glucose-1-phosphate cytidylyltransferase
MTGGRLKRLKKYINKDETFMMTYGDGLSNVNLKKLLSFHKKNKKIATLTAVRPPARFGALKISGNNVNFFKEKSKLDEGWINGGFFVMQSKIFNFIKNDQTYLEREPLERLTKNKQLSAFIHKKFWQCMDTKRDKDNLEKLLKKNYKI